MTVNRLSAVKHSSIKVMACRSALSHIWLHSFNAPAQVEMSLSCVKMSERRSQSFCYYSVGLSSQFVLVTPSSVTQVFYCPLFLKHCDFEKGSELHRSVTFVKVSSGWRITENKGASLGGKVIFISLLPITPLCSCVPPCTNILRKSLYVHNCVCVCV